jgi:hypothetical protein
MNLPLKKMWHSIFLNDQGFQRSLAIDVTAAHRTLGHGEWKATTVLAGSVAEALLLWVLRTGFEPERVLGTATQLVESGALSRQPGNDLLHWHLAELLATAFELKAITTDTYNIGETARNYRNLIHPGREIREEQQCTKGTAHVAIGLMERVIEDLRTRSRNDTNQTYSPILKI